MIPENFIDGRTAVCQPVNEGFPIEDFCGSRRWLVIDGKRHSENLHEYSILFVGSSPVLYHRGKRVTSPWSIELVYRQAEDKKGSSA